MALACRDVWSFILLWILLAQMLLCPCATSHLAQLGEITLHLEVVPLWDPPLCLRLGFLCARWAFAGTVSTVGVSLVGDALTASVVGCSDGSSGATPGAHADGLPTPCVYVA